jgi:hypothetical protein
MVFMRRAVSMRNGRIAAMRGRCLGSGLNKDGDDSGIFAKYRWFLCPQGIAKAISKGKKPARCSENAARRGWRKNPGK